MTTPLRTPAVPMQRGTGVRRQGVLLVPWSSSSIEMPRWECIFSPPLPCLCYFLPQSLSLFFPCSLSRLRRLSLLNINIRRQSPQTLADRCTISISSSYPHHTRFFTDSLPRKARSDETHDGASAYCRPSPHLHPRCPTLHHTPFHLRIPHPSPLHPSWLFGVPSG